MTDERDVIIEEQSEAIDLLEENKRELDEKIRLLEQKVRLLEASQERVRLLQDENDRMRGCLKYLDKHGGLGVNIHDRITKALTRYS